MSVPTAKSGQGPWNLGGLNKHHSTPLLWVRAQARIASSMTVNPHFRTRQAIRPAESPGYCTFRVRSVDIFAPSLFGGRTMRRYDIVPVARVWFRGPSGSWTTVLVIW
jgi:hypothetical protein